MPYSIVGTDHKNSLQKRLAARPEHVERFKALLQQGRLIQVGHNPAIDSQEPGEAGFSVSIIVTEFDSIEDAESWAQGDPYVKAGVYQQVSVKPFNKALP